MPTLPLLIQTLPHCLQAAVIPPLLSRTWNAGEYQHTVCKIRQKTSRSHRSISLYWSTTTSRSMSNRWQAIHTHPGPGVGCGAGRPEARGSQAKNDSNLLPNQRKTVTHPHRAGCTLTTITHSHPLWFLPLKLKSALFICRERRRPTVCYQKSATIHVHLILH